MELSERLKKVSSSIENFEPLGDVLLIEVQDPDFIGSIIIPETTTGLRAEQSNVAVVLAKGKRFKEDIEVGDKVAIKINYNEVNQARLKPLDDSDAFKAKIFLAREDAILAVIED